MLKLSQSSLLVFTALVGATLVGVGCSEKESSEFAADPSQQDAAVDGPGPLLPEAGGPDTSFEAGPSSCPPAIPASFAPTWKAPAVVQGACDATELKEYYDACLANPLKTESDGTCAKFKTDHKACADCAEVADNSGPIQWHQARKFYTLNIGGCIAVAQNAPEPGKCGEAYNAAVQCSRAACDFCFGVGGTFDQFTACQAAAKSQGLCKSYDSAASSACAGYNTAGSPALKCLRSSSAEDAAVYYPRLVGVICGPP